MGAAFLCSSGGGAGGSSSARAHEIYVKGPANVTVTATKGEMTYTKTTDSNGEALLKGLEPGDWTVAITDGDLHASKIVTVEADYNIPIYFFSATINVTYPAGSQAHIEGPDSFYAISPDTSGSWSCTVPAAGDYMVCSDDSSTGNGTYTTVSITEDGQVVSVELSYLKIYGIYRDITASSPDWAREDDAVGKTATASVGTVAGQSDFNNCYPWSGIARETLSTGDVMVKIPKFWYQRYREGNIEHIKISNLPTDGFVLHPAFNHAGVEKECLYVGAYKMSSGYKSVSGVSPLASVTRPDFRTNSAAKGSGWGIVDIAAWSAIQMLILVEFATNDVQTAIGQGYVNGSSAISVGSCDSVPNLTGIPAGTNGQVDVVWRGIEGFWGNLNEFIDGINYSGNKPYVCNDPNSYADGTSTNYTLLSYTSPGAADGTYIKQVGLDAANPHIMLPTTAGGGTSTYYCDKYISASGWRTCRVGGYYSTALSSGLFMTNVNQFASYKAASVGSRLQYIPQ